MKILWFTNISSNVESIKENSQNSGGWISSLESKLKKQKSIELAIAYKKNIDKLFFYKRNNCKYFEIPNNYKLLSKVFPRIGGGKSQSINYYLEVISEYKPDIIHVFGTENDFGLIIPYINIPVVIHIQGVLTSCYLKKHSGKILYNRFQSIEKEYPRQISLSTRFKNLTKKIKNKLNDRNQLENIYNEKKIYSNGKFFMGRTDWDHQIVRSLSNSSKYFHCDEVLRNEFYRSCWTENSFESMNHYISVLGPSPYKGLETVLESAIILKNKGQKFIWKIIGIKEDYGLVQQIESAYRTRFVDNSIILSGKKNENNLINELLNADIFIHPSHIENSSNSICEAMLLGLPIIATYSGGTPSLLKNKKEGLLIPDADPYALVGAILELLNNYSNAIDYGIRAREHAIERHNPDKIIKNLLSIYAEILSIGNIQKA